MQSVLTYKRFRQQVRNQYERDKKRAETLERANVENISQLSQSQDCRHQLSSIDNESSRTGVPSSDLHDIEKGEQLAGEGDVDGGDLYQRETLAIVNTTQSFGTRIGYSLTGIEVRELSEQLTRKRTKAGGNINIGNEEYPKKEIVFVVGYENEKDSMNPHNWSHSTRIGATILIASIGFIVGFASAVDSAALTQAADDFGVSEVTESLATGLFLVGFGFGALFAGPVSETVGRNPVYIATLAIYMIWIMASALAPNIGTQLVFRFLAGLFGSTPLTCAGGSISDILNTSIVER